MRRNVENPIEAVALAITIAFVLIILAPSAQAQTFSVLYDFGVGPIEPTGVTIDRAGALYGGTVYSDFGTEGGTVYKLTNHGSTWGLTTLYTFPPTTQIYTGVIIGANGSLYGATLHGGGGSCDYGCGTVFNLQPPAHACPTALCTWAETTLYSFLGGSDGALPYGLIFDQNGNLYGATYIGGASSNGTVYELTPSGDGWTKTILHSFSGADGANPTSGVILDDAGNLYGTTEDGGSQNYGVVYELSPSGSGWTEQALYSFSDRSDGGYPAGGLVRDRSGNLYGTTLSNGSNHYGGTVFELTPSSGGWNYTLVYSFAGQGVPGGQADLGCGRRSLWHDDWGRALRRWQRFRAYAQRRRAGSIPACMISRDTTATHLTAA